MKRLLFFLLTLMSIQSNYAQQVFWASEVVNFSSQYTPKEMGAKQVLGKPNALPQYGRSLVAWAPETGSKQAHITVAFDKAIQIQQIAIGENLKAGSISLITLIDDKGKSYVIYKNESPTLLLPEKARMFNLYIPLTTYRVAKVRLDLSYQHMGGLPQIDCIGISADKKTIEAKINTLDLKTPMSPPENLGAQVNSPYADMLPIISPDGKMLYFARKNAPENFGVEKRDDIYYSERNISGSWSKAKNIGAPLNTDQHNFVCAISPDGGTMYLANRYDFKSEGSGVAVSHKKKDGSWTKPTSLDIKNMYNKSKYVCYHLSLDGKTLVMALEREDTEGDMDLYVSFKYADGTWTEPMNMGKDLNTAGAEVSIFLAADSKTIYFSSNGHAGYGDLDMFMSKRLDNTWKRWSEPVNMGERINNSGQDLYYTIPATGDYAYFSSDAYGYGSSDLFRILLPRELRPEAVDLNSGLFASSNNVEPVYTLKPQQSASPSQIDERIEALKRQLNQTSSNPEASIQEVDQQEKELEKSIQELQTKYSSAPNNSPNSSPTSNSNYAPAPSRNFSVDMPTIQRATVTYDPSHDEKINAKKRELELLRLKTETPTPVATKSTPSSASRSELSAYEEKLRALEKSAQPVATTETPSSSSSNASSAPKNKTYNPSLSAYEEKLRELEKKSTPTPSANTTKEPVRISAPAKPKASEVMETEKITEEIELPTLEEITAPATTSASITEETIIVKTAIPATAPVEVIAEEKEKAVEKQSPAVSKTIESAPSKDEIALMESKAKLEQEIRALEQEKENMAALRQTQTGEMQAKQEQMLSEKEKIALAIAQMEAEKEQLAMEKERLEREKKQLETLKTQQYRDINALKKELDSLSKLQANASAQVKSTQNSVIDLLETMPLEVGKKLSLNNVYFGANATFLQTRSYDELDKLAAYLLKKTGLKIEVGGHTNGLCDDAFCNELSSKRAKTVVDYLIKKGVSADRLSFKGYGKTANIADNNTEQGRKLNQRVEILITEIGKN